MSDPWQRVAVQIDGLARFEAGWDSYGARPVGVEMREAAKALLPDLPAAAAPGCRVVPTSGGGIQLEWHRGQKVLELEFESPGRIHYLKWHPAAGVEEESMFPALHPERARALVQWFLAEAP